MKSAIRVKGIDTIAVVIINVRIDVSSIGAPKSGRNGIGKMNRSQTLARTTRTFPLFLSLSRIINCHHQGNITGSGENWNFWYVSLMLLVSNNISHD
jgi:hypothetical protein